MAAPDWEQDVPVARSFQLPPEPRFFDAIGHNYEFETAVADLIDNSIDAQAKTVLARFIMTSGMISGFVVVDDGQGIPAEKIDVAVTLGGARSYN